MGTETRIGITLGVFAVMAVLWWIFDSASRDSRRAAFGRRLRRRSAKRLARGWRRPSFIGFAFSSALILVVLAWSTIRCNRLSAWPRHRLLGSLAIGVGGSHVSAWLIGLNWWAAVEIAAFFVTLSVRYFAPSIR